MDEFSALHLSYILANHHPPNQLLIRVPPAKAGPHAQQLSAYDSETKCRGIIYLPNPTLSNAANKVLELAEKVRDGLQGSSASNNIEEQNVDEDGANSIDRETFHAADHRRRSSTKIDEETHESMVADLDRARSRLQGNAIECVGHRSNDLWCMALKMLATSRNIIPQTASDPAPSPEPPRTKPQVIRTLEIPGITLKKAHVLSSPLGPRSSNQTISPRQNRPRKDSISTPLVPRMVSQTSSMLSRVAESRFAPLSGKEYRSKLPCGFPEDAWWQILGYATNASGLLSPGQQRSVLRYGMDRGTLRKERDTLGLKEAAQIWHVLEGMDCLAYEMR
ncbi:MAG: hypothetical protein Q9217_000816 [Psora testacea]